jgi:hypothetical protein
MPECSARSAPLRLSYFTLYGVGVLKTPGNPDNMHFAAILRVMWLRQEYVSDSPRVPSPRPAYHA